MRMRIEYLANGDLLLMYVYVDNYVFRQACVCTYSDSVILFVVIDKPKLSTVNALLLTLFNDEILGILEYPC